MTFKHVLKVRGGHRFYVDDTDGSIAVTDDSLRDLSDPSTTDDGLLLIDRQRPTVFAWDRIYIPVVMEDGSDSATSERPTATGPLLAMLREQGIPCEVHPDLAYAAKSIAVALLQGGLK